MRRLGIVPSRTLRQHFLALARRTRESLVVSDGPAKIGVTSLKRGAGRSTVAFNLAAALTRIAPEPVLLVESDFGRHFVARRLGVAGSLGLSDIICGEADPTRCIIDSPNEKFSVMPCGRVSDQDSLELPFERMEHIFSSNFERFGFLIFDLPVANNLSACHSIVPHLDAVILTVDANSIDREQLERTKQRFADCGTELLGVVVNRKD